MKFAKILGFPLSVIGLILYSPPVYNFLARQFGDYGRLSGAVIFALGWALLLGYVVFEFGMRIQKDRSN